MPAVKLPSQRQKTPALPPVSKSSVSAGPELSQAASSSATPHPASMDLNRIISSCSIVSYDGLRRQAGGCGKDEAKRSRACVRACGSRPVPRRRESVFHTEGRSSDLFLFKVRFLRSAETACGLCTCLLPVVCTPAPGVRIAVRSFSVCGAMRSLRCASHNFI